MDGFKNEHCQTQDGLRDGCVCKKKNIKQLKVQYIGIFEEIDSFY